MGVDLGRLRVGVAEVFLDGPKRLAVRGKAGRKGVPRLWNVITRTPAPGRPLGTAW